MSTRNYEAMFILENNAATADFDETSGTVDAILQKHGAEIVQKEKWDERKLAYEIKGQRRGTYYLTYFTANPTAIDNINEDVRLTELILRHMVLALDKPIAEHIELVEKEREMLAEDSRKNALGGWGDRDRDRDRRRRGPGAPPSKPEGDAAPKDAAPKAAAPKDAAAKDAAAKDAAPTTSPSEGKPAESAAADAPSAVDTGSKDTGSKDTSSNDASSNDEGTTSEPTSKS